MISFNNPLRTGKELSYVQDAFERNQFSGNGHYTKLCEAELEALTQTSRCLLTSSCSHALDMCAILLDIKPDDEIIMASYNFVSAANAFVNRGAKVCFVDIDPNSMNINVQLIEEAINPNTKAILAMHYGGVACDMFQLKKLADKYKLYLVEDAAHCIDAYHKESHLGTIGDLGTISFHASKNIHCGEGGALLINNKDFIERAEIIREKGTNRAAFNKGLVSKYTWVDLGSSYIMSEISAAFLYAQIQSLSKVKNQRKALFEEYHNHFSLHIDEKDLSPNNTGSNYHLFYLKVNNRKALIADLKEKAVEAYFHYIPLHSSEAGLKHAYFSGTDVYTSKESERLLRLPLYCDLNNQSYIIEAVSDYLKYGNR